MVNIFSNEIGCFWAKMGGFLGIFFFYGAVEKGLGLGRE